MTALTPDEVRSLLRECVTVVAPGETLVVQVGDQCNPNQIREMHEALNCGWDTGDPVWPFRVLIVPGDGLGVQPVPTPGEVADLITSGAISINKGRSYLGLPLFDAPEADEVPAPSAFEPAAPDAPDPDGMSKSLASLGLPPLPAASDPSLPAPSLSAAFKAFCPPGTDADALMASLRASRMPEIQLGKSAGLVAGPSPFTQPGTTCAACHARGVAAFHAPDSDECRDRQADLDRLEKEKPAEVTWCHACTRPHPRSLICPEQRDMAARVAEAAAKLAGGDQPA